MLGLAGLSKCSTLVVKVTEQTCSTKTCWKQEAPNVHARASCKTMGLKGGFPRPSLQSLPGLEHDLLITPGPFQGPSPTATRHQGLPNHMACTPLLSWTPPRPAYFLWASPLALPIPVPAGAEAQPAAHQPPDSDSHQGLAQTALDGPEASKPPAQSQHSGMVKCSRVEDKTSRARVRPPRI